MRKAPSTRFEYIQLTSAYAPAFGFGGPIRLMYEYAKWMADAGFSVAVITGDVNHDFTHVAKKKEFLYGIEIRRVRVWWHRLVRKNINLVSTTMLGLAIRRVWQTHGPVIVHVWEVRGLVPLYGLVLKKLFPGKVVLVHSAFGQLHYKNSMLRIMYDRLFLRPLLASMDMGLAQNDHEINRYRELLAQYEVNEYNRLVLFPLSVNTKEGNKGIGNMITVNERLDLRRKYGIQDDVFVCIFLGRLHPAKGIIRAIDAFLAFSELYSGQTLFLIVGRDDGMQQHITDYISEHNASSSIRIVNNVYDTRFDYYTLADLFLGFPTIDEETMLASVEALSCGTPILVSREADIPFVEEEWAGFVIDFTVDVAVDRILRISNKLDSFRHSAYEVANRYFSASYARHRFTVYLNKAVQKCKESES